MLTLAVLSCNSFDGFRLISQRFNRNINFMKLEKMIRRAFTLCSMSAVLTVSSMVALAGPVKPVGELVVSGGDGQATVNGEPVRSGRTVFASSTITTPEGSTAILNMGKAGKMELAPGTTYTIAADGTLSGGSLSTGSVTVLNGENIKVKTMTGEEVNVNSGEAANANSSAAAAAQNRKYGGLYWWGWALIAGGVATGIIIYAATRDDDRQASPVR